MLARLEGVEPPTLGLEVLLNLRWQPSAPNKSLSLQAVRGDLFWAVCGAICTGSRTNPAHRHCIAPVFLPINARGRTGGDAAMANWQKRRPRATISSSAARASVTDTSTACRMPQIRSSSGPKWDYPRRGATFDANRTSTETEAAGGRTGHLFFQSLHDVWSQRFQAVCQTFARRPEYS